MKKPLSSFIGINNVEAAERHAPGELTVGLDVDITATRALRSRLGRRRLATLAGCAHSLYRCDLGLLCVVEADLLLFDEQGGQLGMVQEAVGHSRMWHVPLPGGSSIAFSNGLLTGVTAGGAARPWGVPTPDGSAVDAVAGLVPFWLTYRRLDDGLESGAYFGPPIDIRQPLRNLPVEPGYELRVYFAPDGRQGFLAGSTTTDEFVFSGSEAALVQPCLTPHVVAPPPGICLTRWKARVLIAAGRVLWATLPFQPEQVDARRDFIQFEAPITLVHGQDGGVWVGTEKGLHWLAGTTFEQLVAQNVMDSPVVLGSMAECDFTLLPADNRPGQAGAFCLVGGSVCAIGDGGQITTYGADRYRSDITEAVATTRVRDGVLQYVVAQRRKSSLGVGVAVEVDAAVARSLVTVGDILSRETDEAAQLLAQVFAPAGVAIELNDALTLLPVQIGPTLVAVESTSSVALVAAQITAVGRASEFSTAISLDGSLEAPAGAADEIDTALALPYALALATGAASETSIPYAMRPKQIMAVGMAMTAEAAVALQPSIQVPIAASAETDTAITLGSGGAPGIAQEQDTAIAPQAPSILPVGIALEAEQSFGLVRKQLVQAGMAVEVDAAVQRGVERPVGTSVEADVALPLAPPAFFFWMPVDGAAGYRVYWGVSSGPPYSNVVDVGNVISVQQPDLVGLTPGTYWFNVTSYDDSGLESAFGTEVQRTAV